MESQLVVLVHGYFKNSHDMIFLSQGLKSRGYNTISVILPTTFGTIDECSNSLEIQINHLIYMYKEVHFIGHSMGGLIIQKYLSKNIISNLGKCIFIATPFKGSKLAKIFCYVPLLSTIFKPLIALSIENKLSTNINQYTNIKVGVIAGIKNNLLAGNIFLSDLSDGRVEIESTKLSNMSDYIELPYGHKEIHHKMETLEEIEIFLKVGYFNHQKVANINSV